MNDNHGLTDKQRQQLVDVFVDYPSIEAVKIYGSRAKGNYTNTSDIDLAMFGQNIDRFLIADLLMELNETDIPFLIDAQNYHALKNIRLKDHIDRVGQYIYRRDEQ